MKVYVVIGDLPECRAGYMLLGTYMSEEAAEKRKQEKEANPGLAFGCRFRSVEVWEDELKD